MSAKAYGQCSALVVGGTSGIGAETARSLITAGIGRIAVAGRDQGRLDRVVRDLEQSGRSDIVGLSFDASDIDSARAGVSEAEQRLGGIDILVSSIAADVVPELLLQTSPTELGPTLTGQLLAPLLLTRLALPAMCDRGSGSVVLVSSDAAKVATPGESVIGAAMAGIVMFARAAAMETKRHGVRINTVTPSLVTGTATTARITAGGFSARLFAAAEKQAHLGVTEPSDVANLITFLAGPAARRITGQAISVNGGISAA